VALLRGLRDAVNLMSNDRNQWGVGAGGRRRGRARGAWDEGLGWRRGGKDDEWHLVILALRCARQCVKKQILRGQSAPPLHIMVRNLVGCIHVSKMPCA
jgi:hypothetical protein